MDEDDFTPDPVPVICVDYVGKGWTYASEEASARSALHHKWGGGEPHCMDIFEDVLMRGLTLRADQHAAFIDRFFAISLYKNDVLPEESGKDDTESNDSFPKMQRHLRFGEGGVPIFVVTDPAPLGSAMRVLTGAEGYVHKYNLVRGRVLKTIVDLLLEPSAEGVWRVGVVSLEESVPLEVLRALYAMGPACVADVFPNARDDLDGKHAGISLALWSSACRVCNVYSLEKREDPLPNEEDEEMPENGEVTPHSGATLSIACYVLAHFIHAFAAPFNCRGDSLDPNRPTKMALWDWILLSVVAPVNVINLLESSNEMIRSALAKHGWYLARATALSALLVEAAGLCGVSNEKSNSPTGNMCPDSMTHGVLPADLRALLHLLRDADRLINVLHFSSIRASPTAGELVVQHVTRVPPQELYEMLVAEGRLMFLYQLMQAEKKTPLVHLRFPSSQVCTVADLVYTRNWLFKETQINGIFVYRVAKTAHMTLRVNDLDELQRGYFPMLMLTQCERRRSTSRADHMIVNALESAQLVRLPATDAIVDAFLNGSEREMTYMARVLLDILRSGASYREHMLAPLVPFSAPEGGVIVPGHSAVSYYRLMPALLALIESVYGLHGPMCESYTDAELTQDGDTSLLLWAVGFLELSAGHFVNADVAQDTLSYLDLKLCFEGDGAVFALLADDDERSFFSMAHKRLEVLCAEWERNGEMARDSTVIRAMRPLSHTTVARMGAKAYSPDCVLLWRLALLIADRFGNADIGARLALGVRPLLAPARGFRPPPPRQQLGSGGAVVQKKDGSGLVSSRALPLWIAATVTGVGITVRPIPTEKGGVGAAFARAIALMELSSALAPKDRNTRLAKIPAWSGSPLAREEHALFGELFQEKSVAGAQSLIARAVPTGELFLTKKHMWSISACVELERRDPLPFCAARDSEDMGELFFNLNIDVPTTTSESVEFLRTYSAMLSGRGEAPCVLPDNEVIPAEELVRRFLVGDEIIVEEMTPPPEPRLPREEALTPPPQPRRAEWRDVLLSRDEIVRNAAKKRAARKEHVRRVKAYAASTADRKRHGVPQTEKRRVRSRTFAPPVVEDLRPIVVVPRRVRLPPEIIVNPGPHSGLGCGCGSPLPPSRLTRPVVAPLLTSYLEAALYDDAIVDYEVSSGDEV